MKRVGSGDSRHVLWQKERLLNPAIEALPSDVDAVAWLDADLIWLNRNWVEKARQLLERYNAVQLFEHLIDTDGEGRVGQRSPGHVHAKTHGLAYGRPRGAWAARREGIVCGLYDRHAIGGGDTAMLMVWEGRKELPPSLQFGSAWEEHYHAWAARRYEQVHKSLAYVPGDVLHLYHGTRQKPAIVHRGSFQFGGAISIPRLRNDMKRENKNPAGFVCRRDLHEYIAVGYLLIFVILVA